MSNENTFGVIFNNCYGGFVFSDLFINEFEKEYGDKISKHDASLRDDPRIIDLFNKLGSEASSGNHSKLKIIYLPAEIAEYYYVSEYDGVEDVHVSFDELYEKLLLEALNESADKIKIKEKYEFFKKLEDDFK